MSRRGSHKKSGAKPFYCIKCIEILEADHRVCRLGMREKVFKRQSLIGKVLVHKYFKTKVQENKLNDLKLNLTPENITQHSRIE